MTDACGTVDVSDCPDWDTYDPDTQARAEALATSTLRMLTGFRTFNCPVILRPCREGCHARTWGTHPVLAGGSWAGAGTGFVPTVIDGQWYNIACLCGATGCSCTEVCEIVLPGEAASIDEVRLDGAVLDPTAYRIDNGHLLVRTDGECWPLCQDMNVGIDDEGSFAVTYTPGVAVDETGAYLAGLLACEYAKASTGRACRLPSNVTRLTRLGVTMELAGQTFPNGLTGIREVDIYIRRWNPNGLVAPSLVWSPDVRTPRVTTWPVTP